MTKAARAAASDVADSEFDGVNRPVRPIDRKKMGVVSDVKPPKSFSVFSGKSGEYRVWRDRTMDLAAKVDGHWKRVLRWILKQQNPLTMETLSLSTELGIGG